MNNQVSAVKVKLRVWPKTPQLFTNLSNDINLRGAPFIQMLGAQVCVRMDGSFNK